MGWKTGAAITIPPIGMSTKLSPYSAYRNSLTNQTANVMVVSPLVV